MKKLQIRLKRVDNVVLGWVEHQVTGLPRGTLVYNPDHQVVRTIAKANCPALSADTLYVRGDSTLLDFSIFARSYDSATVAEGAYHEIKALVAQVNASGGDSSAPCVMPKAELVE